MQCDMQCGSSVTSDTPGALKRTGDNITYKTLQNCLACKKIA